MWDEVQAQLQICLKDIHKLSVPVKENDAWIQASQQYNFL